MTLFSMHQFVTVAFFTSCTVRENYLENLFSYNVFWPLSFPSAQQHLLPNENMSVKHAIYIEFTHSILNC